MHEQHHWNRQKSSKTYAAIITTQQQQLDYISMWCWHFQHFHIILYQLNFNYFTFSQLPWWHVTMVMPSCYNDRESVESASTQVVGDDDVGDCIKDKLNVVGIRGARLVTIDLFHLAAVLCFKLRLDVNSSLLIRRRPCKVSKLRMFNVRAVPWHMT